MTPDDSNHRERVLVYLHLLSNPDASDRFKQSTDREASAIELCRLWIEEIYLPGYRNLDGLKSDRSEIGAERFNAQFTRRELELLYQFHRFLELRLEMLRKRLPAETSFPDGDFWQNIFRHARNVLVEIDPERLELDEVLRSTPHLTFDPSLRSD